MTRVLSVVGARPNFMKVAPLHRELVARGRAESVLVHTGQHYDALMSDVFMAGLELPEPAASLDAGSGTHAEQTARVMVGFERALGELQPDLVVVVGDVNSTLACALVAAKRGVPLAHVEAGLRSGERSMPEEVNRVLTDRLSDLLFVTEESGLRNLEREGIPAERVHFVGNVMIDSLLHARASRPEPPTAARLGLQGGEYVVVTLHRPCNVDVPDRLEGLARALGRIASARPVVFPAHPRTRERLERAGLRAALGDVRLLEPMGYAEFLSLVEHAGVVVTDSGGLQEETTWLGVPCLTVRNGTERPVTVELGTNRLCPGDPAVLVDHVRRALQRTPEPTRARAGGPPLWDGRTAPRIVDVIEGFLDRGAPAGR
ncbi:MAG: UDP-N-acetylglucosamine 2-epimerase (non-hydrolyzing) [Candidatus Palauibacterales bacterium]|nr:UDP-N-acetylglucosamine 2-epimerase (non-hydrolyzing) [Candidatus Palauibacterales bacterium]MDP2582508.1 UDP-N-acetylglucosamine 2-epimerase (non-hydrolyzing) [Candidatus Palauibacterales bacterium]